MGNTYYGFSSGNASEDPAWFHTPEAAARFKAACDVALGEIETTDEAAPEDILDTAEVGWTKDEPYGSVHS